MRSEPNVPWSCGSEDSAMCVDQQDQEEGVGFWIL